jgi:hypothetical protein
MGKKHISQLQQQKRSQEITDQVLADVLKLSQKRFKKFDEIIQHLYANDSINQYYFKDARIVKIADYFNALKNNNQALRIKFLNLLLHLEKSSLITKEVSLIQGLFNAVKFSSHWLHPIEEWKPIARSADRQFKELVEFLFCKYEVPAFLVKSLFETSNLLYINWLIHLGNGGKVKLLHKMPITFTQKMAHHFIQAPDSFSIPEAIRWGQTIGLGGDKQLANRIAHSWLGHKPYGDEDMWEQFIRLVIAGVGMFNYNKVTELIDYIREAKRNNNDYHLKGKTLQSLMRQSDEWHNRFSTTKGVQSWKPCGIENYRAKHEQEIVILEELTNSIQLVQEGNTMRHCVASYAYYCAKGRTSIFSMRKYLGDVKLEVMATVEIDLASRKVVQAKARMNNAISKEAKKHLVAWADNQSLTVSAFL